MSTDRFQWSQLVFPRGVRSDHPRRLHFAKERMDHRTHQRHHLPDSRSHVSGKIRNRLQIQTALTDSANSGAFIVDPLNYYLGRRGEIFLTAVCLTATPIGSAFAQSWQGLFAARFVMGIGIGAKNATVPIYSAEMAPARIRGALVMFWQLWVVIGELSIPPTRCAFANHWQAFSWASAPMSS